MKKRILNLGCGNDTFGTDFIDMYIPRKEVVKCDVCKEKLPYKTNTFDLVYCKNAFEHFTNPITILKEIKRVLKKEGKIQIITDNAGFFLFHIPLRMNNFLQHNSNVIRKIKGDRHYFLFTALHLENLLEYCGGFKNIKTKYEYRSPNKIVNRLRPLLNILNKTFLVRIINPHVEMVAKKK